MVGTVNLIGIVWAELLAGVVMDKLVFQTNERGLMKIYLFLGRTNETPGTNEKRYVSS